MEIRGSNPHFRLNGYVDKISTELEKTHGFIVPALFYSNVYEDSITHLPTITIGSPVVINDFNAQSSKMSGIIATDYTQTDLSGLFQDAFNKLNIQNAGYDIHIHSLKGQDIAMNIFPSSRSWVSFDLGDIKLMDGFLLSARVHFSELLRVKAAGIISTNIIMLFFLLLFIRSHKRTEQMMGKLTTDSLTRALSREGGKIVMESTPKSRNTILVTMDLNDFKVINDTWGHHVGDEALIYFANYLLASVRQGDHLIRMGGDEFVLLLQNTTLTQARKMMDTRVAGLSEFPFENHMIPLSFSFGLSELVYGFTESFKKADENLYIMKKERKAKISQRISQHPVMV